MKIKCSSVKDHNFKYQIPLGKNSVLICQSPAEIINMYYDFQSRFNRVPGTY